MPSYDMVFKIIKDRIDPPKTTSLQEVIERYEPVFRHDRAGRMVDAQEFDTFLGLLEPLRSVFTRQHADLFGVKF